MSPFRTVVWSVIAASVAAAPAHAQPARAIRTRPAADAIADALRSHAIVMIAEHHQSSPVHALLRALLASPKVRDRIDDIVLEFANPLYQPIIDRYIAGAAVPRDSLRLAWRNTTQLLVWDSPLYEQFFETVRRLNTAPNAGRQLRIVAGDPPIDWSRTARASDIPRSYGSATLKRSRSSSARYSRRVGGHSSSSGRSIWPRMSDTLRATAVAVRRSSGLSRRTGYGRARGFAG